MRRSPVRIRLPAPNSPKTSVFGEFYFVVTAADTLRCYERIGLIPPVPHSKSGIRGYDEASCGWIEWMKSITRAPPKG
ncbi:MerR family DNA-binding transcriptional regulator [Intestinimonas massiliensis (ex Afouda et al. 2020)]|uniref:MerR family DNA-binding transcriptional regulator n=1 Tax=Intestinimonas massiliensis (ex Afouda et al. 2020) TaxID=1673721 RepID=UPI003F68A150